MKRNGEDELLISDQAGESQYLEARSRKGSFLLIGSALVLNFLCVGFGFSLSVFYPEFTRVFDADRSITALIQSIYTSFLFGGILLWNPFVTRYGQGKCILCGACICTLGVFLSCFSANVWMVLACIGVVSAIGGCIVTIGPFLLINNVMGKWKHASLAVIPIGSSFGQFVFAYLVEYLIEEYNWNGALLIMSGLLANMIPFGLIISYIEKDFSKLKISPNKLVDKVVFKEWRYYLLLISGFLMTFSCFVESKFLVDFMILEGFDRSTGSRFVSFVGLSNFAGRIAGVLQKLVYKGGNSLLQLSFLILVNGSTHAIILFNNTYSGILVGSVLNGLSYGLCVAHLPIIMLEIFRPELYGPALSFWNISGGLGSFLGGYFGGYIEDVTGNYDILFEIATVLSVIISVFFFITGVTVTRYCRGRGNGYIKV